MKRILKALGWVAAGVIVLTAALAALGYQLFVRAPDAADVAPATDQTQARQQDLDYVRYVMTFDRSFSDVARAAFDKTMDELAAHAGELDDAKLEMGVMRAIALADNGHTALRETGWGSYHLQVLPLRFAWFAEGLFIVKADSALADLLGAQVLSIAGRPAEALARDLYPYYGGPDSLRHELAPHLMQSPQALHAIGLAPSPKEAMLALKLRDGSESERTIAARTEQPPEDSTLRWPKRSLSPVPLPEEKLSWVHVLDGLDPLPPYLRNPNRKYWHMYLDGGRRLFVQINKLLDQGDTPFKVYLAQLLQEIAVEKPHDVIVDLRFSSGGNYELASDFSRRLPELLPADGRIFVLSSGDTFSAAIVTAARLKYFGGARTAIVGEPMGDREEFWAEGTRKQLPNSKMTATYATGYHDWERGCRDVLKCYWVNLFMDVPAGELSPTMAAPLRFSDYVAGKDSAFEALQAASQPPST
jgi:hypothetical protein